MTDELEDDKDAEALALLVDGLPAVQPPAHARARLLAELTGAARLTPLAREVAERFGVPLARVLEAFARIDDDGAWHGSPAPGPAFLPLHGRTVISRLPAGTRIPRHTHALRELTFVLDGSIFSDGVEHRRASVMDMAPGTAHALHVSGAQSCLVVFAEVPIG